MDNYILKQIAEACDNAPSPREPTTLEEFQRRLDDYSERLDCVLGWTHELDGILSGAPHDHAAGTMIGLHIDTCAKCGRDIRDDIHTARKYGRFD